MLYKGENCPVCKRQFEENDDVVFCPECGTPHHRECYELTGHCVNRSLHKTGYDYRSEHAPADTKEEKTDNNGERNTGFFPPSPDGAFAANGFPKLPYENDTDTICGEKVADVAAAVRSNAPRFIEIFRKQEKTGKKAGWNWGAFFFGSYYFFYRKMFKQAITLLCVNITLSSLLSLLAIKLAPLTTNALNELQSFMTSNGPDAVYEKITEIQNLADFGKFTSIYLGFTAAAMLIRIIVTVFADSIYKENVTSFIKRVNEQLNAGASFRASVLTQDETDTVRLGQEQMKRIFLVKKGGVSLWAPVAAYMVITLINFITGAR